MRWWHRRKAGLRAARRACALVQARWGALVKTGEYITKESHRNNKLNTLIARISLCALTALFAAILPTLGSDERAPNWDEQLSY
jgi:hypothetical protein